MCCTLKNFLLNFRIKWLCKFIHETHLHTIVPLICATFHCIMLYMSLYKKLFKWLIMSINLIKPKLFWLISLNMDWLQLKTTIFTISIVLIWINLEFLINEKEFLNLFISFIIPDFEPLVICHYPTNEANLWLFMFSRNCVNFNT